jgi:hypothetical protein
VVYLDSERAIKDPTTRPAALKAVSDALATAGDRTVLVAMHHPYVSHGPHGTAVKTPWSCLGGDEACPAFQEWRSELGKVLAAAPEPGRVLLVSGHEHDVQLLPIGIDGIRQVVAGGTAEPKCVPSNGPLVAGDSSLHEGPGFAVLDVWDDRSELRLAALVAPGAAGCVRVKPDTPLTLQWSAPVVIAR